MYYEQSQQNQPGIKLPFLPSTHLKYLYFSVPFSTPQYSEFCQVVPSATNHLFVCIYVCVSGCVYGGLVWFGLVFFVFQFRNFTSVD